MPHAQQPPSEFRMQLTALRADVDELGHVSNIAYVRWIQEVAARHSESVGLTWPDYQRLGGMFVVRRHEIDYLRPAFEGDRIELVTYVASLRGASSERVTRVLREKDGVELASARTLWAYLARETGRPARIPAAILRAFSQAP